MIIKVVQWKNSIFQAKFDETMLWRLNWYENLLAIGCTNGHILVWDINEFLDTKYTTQYDKNPLFYCQVHTSAIFDICWVKDFIESGLYILSVDSIGNLKAIDFKDPWMPIHIYNTFSTVKLT